MIDYKKSGVDIEAGDNLVSWLQNPLNPQKTKQSKTFTGSDVPDFRDRVVSGIGGFAALFDAKFPSMANPVFVSCTDGVGTKVKLASYFNDFSTVGQDLVAMCANDLICTGGTPLFFLDYYAVGKLELDKAQEFLSGVRAACEKSHMVLIGGETAEMPGVYQPGDFDCAGFSVGIVDKQKMWKPELVQAGDAVIGVSSSGFHSNGFSLIRKVFEGEFDKYRKWLLEPTRLYVEAALALRSEFEIHGMAHMTGGGIENLPRILPSSLSAKIKKWDMPECFLEVQKRAGISDSEMRTTFNCGIGLIIILPANQSEGVLQKLNELGYEAQFLGLVETRQKDAPHVEWA